MKNVIKRFFHRLIGRNEQYVCFEVKRQGAAKQFDFIKWAVANGHKKHKIDHKTMWMISQFVHYVNENLKSEKL
jgi:hypothetical protein